MPNERELQIISETLIEQKRRLPSPGEILVKEGDVVAPETILARGLVTNPEVHDVKVYEQLDIDAVLVEEYMLKREGDKVDKDEIIAYRRSFFGLVEKTCKSPIEGVIEHFSAKAGRALIRGKPIPIEVKAHIPGKVITTIPREGALVHCTAAYMQGIFGVGGETNGELRVTVDSPEAILTRDTIIDEHKGKILVGGSLLTLETLNEAQKKGVKGIISGGMEQSDLVTFLGYEIGLGITGHEKSGITLILTEGFGRKPIDERRFQLLRSFDKKQASINGTTQIRFNMIRPEIILPIEIPLP